MDLKEPVDCPARGTVIEARMDRRQGAMATLLVQRGTLKVGDCVLAGPSWGRVRKILTDQGTDVKSVGPSTPVQVL